MIVVCSYLFLFALVVVSGWIGWIRVRGSLGFWLRKVKRRECWAVGRVLDEGADDEKLRAEVAEVSALVRTLDRESGIVIRAWDREDGSRFLGLLLDSEPDRAPEAPYEVRHLPAATVLRGSGRSNTDGVSLADAAREYAGKEGLEVAFGAAARVSGQSFWYYEWGVTGEVEDSDVEPLSERIFRMREIVLFPVLLGLFGLGLVGTGNGPLFAVGMLLLIFLSGACKFVFVHQREDESQEEHLQNY